MFRQITAILFLAAISLQIMNRVLVYVDYYVNTAAYAKNCENKARPMMHCNGKCQMMKKLQQQEKKDNQTPPERKSISDQVVSSKSFFASLIVLSKEISSSYSNFPGAQPVQMPRYCFHPPSA